MTYKWTAIILSSTSSVVSVVKYIILFCKARILRNNVNIAVVHQPDINPKKEMVRKMNGERQANITVFLLFLALIGVSFPSLIFVSLGRVIVFIHGTAIPTAYNVAQILASSSLIIIDPIVIMSLNRDFREATGKLFKVPKAKRRLDI